MSSQQSVAFTQYDLPLPANSPLPPYPHPVTPSSYGCAVDRRDMYQGDHCCIICLTIARKGVLRAHIVSPKEENDTWQFLRGGGYIPHQAQPPSKEPRNALTFCYEHYNAFKEYKFFIRYLPHPINRYILVNISDSEGMQEHHMRALYLDPANQLCPFPGALLVHELRARSQNPYRNLIDPSSRIQLSDVPWVKDVQSIPEGPFSRVVRRITRSKE
ncbi:hypothetical protein CVT26_002905 [Gymnopilus dilepis]|uniref:HNH nuclease domain-containing protein n=1 Tax=Gymnopilus dilepis TaxID=231916 RepID=A0A409X178_9AGAR|nr:hypothetical protein CVT26_002905 [Gymnopilus dilepis]